jgi:hypothetical protein
MLNKTQTTAAKVLICAVLLIALVAYAAHNMAPQLSYALIFAYALLGFSLVAIALVGLSLIYLTIYQWVLRKGGTDPAWFWFSSEPKGLVALRLSKARENKQ